MPLPQPRPESENGLVSDLDAFGDQLFDEDLIDVLDDDNAYAKAFVALQCQVARIATVTQTLLDYRNRHATDPGGEAAFLRSNIDRLVRLVGLPSHP